MDYPRLAFLLRPYLKRELPGWGKLFRLLHIDGIDNTNPYWRHAPKRTIRSKAHGYWMELDLSDDVERNTFFLSRYYDLENQLVFDGVLNPGDTFVDGGANIGMTTLHAANRVGAGGRVLAFEPQHGCAEKIRKQLVLNDIRHVQVHEVGLGERAAELTLSVLGGGSVLANFGDVSKAAWVREQYQCPIIRGDDRLRGQVVGKLMIKLDLEGYELYALRGLEETITSYFPPIMTEVAPRNLRRAGVDEHQLFAHLHERNYRAYAISLSKRRLRHRLHLRSVERPGELGQVIDVLWLPRSGSHFDPAPHLG
jgi:FkbM family methyltransferase